MDDIWIISWFNHIAFDANPIWKSPMSETNSTTRSPDYSRVYATMKCHSASQMWVELAVVAQGSIDVQYRNKKETSLTASDKNQSQGSILF